MMGAWVLGLFLTPWGRDPALLLIMVLGTVVGCALIAAQSRYRLPLDPLMAPQAAAALLAGAGVLGVRRRAAFWFLGAPALVFLVWVWVSYLPFSYPS